MRNMSFALTTAQYNARTKTETMRLGWANLKPGEVFMGILKGQGLKKGEKVTKLHASRCVSNTPARVDSVTKANCIAEGFPELEPAQFVEFFCKHNKVTPDTIINRIVSGVTLIRKRAARAAHTVNPQQEAGIMQDTERVSLENLAHGAAIERFNLALSQVLENILDPNTDAKTKREVVLKVGIKPTEDRESGRVEVTTSTKLANYKAVETTIYIGTVGGEAAAVEHNPKQMRFDEVVANAGTDSKGVS